MSKQEFGGRYRVSGPIASGGMAEVLMARDELLDRPVALKTLHPQYANDKAFIERFRREAQAVASLNDPRIVSIFDWGSDNGTYFIVMEYVEGRTLREMIQSEGPLSPERAVEIAADVCGALDIAHQKGIVHRDVKPANIAVTRNGQTKVMDFGIARATTDSGTTMTQAGTVIGTANYLSPEQAQGMAVDARSDVYSVGVVLYEMLTREVPFKGDSPVAIAYKHVKEDPAPPSMLNHEVTPGIDAVVMKALAKNPDNRYTTALEMKQDLERIIRGEEVEATPILPPDQTAVMEPADRTMVMPAPSLPSASPRRKAVAYLLIVSLFLSVLVLAGLLIASLFGGAGTTVEVPRVAGLTKDEAVKRIQGAGLKAIIDPNEFSDSVPEGTVVSQDPEDGRKVPKGSDIHLIVSKGPSQVAVPSVVGMTQTEAENALKEAGLRVGAITNKFDSSVPAGKVIDQDPAAGSTLDRDKPVNLIVSGGAKTVRVPDLTGLDEDNARQRLSDIGLIAKTVDTCNTSQRDGRVMDQNPAAGQELAEGSTVTLTINRVPKVPKVIGQTEESAVKELQDAGFKVEIIETTPPPGKNVDTVVAQDPAPGTSSCKGDTVTITVEKSA
ncbi:MAG: Stk1 family PASTA domain-containing Ser/Thr kinase [Actinomycetota bacterium]|nr:Stk1 family PASTA domain-containing Ser/Thr kinase [Actinomycetota bacterium]